MNNNEQYKIQVSKNNVKKLVQTMIACIKKKKKKKVGRGGGRKSRHL